MERESRVMVFRFEEPGELRPAGEHADLAEALMPAGADGCAGPLLLLPLEEPARWPELVTSLVSSYDLLFVRALEMAGVGDGDPDGFLADLEARIDRCKARQG